MIQQCKFCLWNDGSLATCVRWVVGSRSRVVGSNCFIACVSEYNVSLMFRYRFDIFSEDKSSANESDKRRAARMCVVRAHAQALSLNLPGRM